MATPLDSTLEELRQSDAARWGKHAQAKHRTVSIAVQLATQKTPMEKNYRDAYYCADVIIEKDGKRTTKFCGQRCCVQCNYHRTTRTIRTYAPIIDGWQDVYLVTLTVPCVNAGDLRRTMDSLLEQLHSVQNSMRRTHKCPLRAIRFLECTVNEGQYHPHYHLIVQGKATVELLVRLWLERNPSAAPNAQRIDPVAPETTSNLLTYLTKYIPDAAKDASLEELDVIFTAFKGRRLLQPMGFKASAGSDTEIDDTQVSISSITDGDQEAVKWYWQQSEADWIRRDTGEYLTEQEPPVSRPEPVRKQVNILQQKASPGRIKLRTTRKQRIIHRHSRKRYGQTTNHG